MRFPTPPFSILLLLAPLTLATTADNPPTPEQLACKSKSTATGSGAFDAIKGFCQQLDAQDASSSFAANGYTAGGFQPSGVTSTAGITTTGCGGNVPTLSMEHCETEFYGICSVGNKSGQGRGSVGCLGLEIV